MTRKELVLGSGSRPRKLLFVPGMETFEDVTRLDFNADHKPDGYFFGIVPSWDSLWALGDPSHTRVISNGTLVFLFQKSYVDQVGKTPMSDFRFYYKADFELIDQRTRMDTFQFILKANKN